MRLPFQFVFIDNEILSVLNNGTIKELKKLQGVGQKRAQLIADWRTVHGPFQQVNCTEDGFVSLKAKFKFFSQNN